MVVAGRNPASRWWPNHNPNVVYVEPSRKARSDRHETETRRPLMLADVVFTPPTPEEVAAACQAVIDRESRR